MSSDSRESEKIVPVQEMDCTEGKEESGSTGATALMQQQEHQQQRNDADETAAATTDQPATGQPSPDPVVETAAEDDFDPETVVSEAAFWHIEASHRNGFSIGMKVELEHDCDLKHYWIAEIVGNFGQMLSLRWEEDGDSFFFDLQEKRFFPIGYYRTLGEGHQLSPPTGLVVGDDSLVRLKALCDDPAVCQSQSEPLALFAAGGLKTCLFRVEDVMRVSLKDQPQTYWFANIVQNIGGRLLLRWVLPDSVSEQNTPFWLFYSHPRVLIPSDVWASQYEPPVTFDGWESMRDEYIGKMHASGDQEEKDRFMLQDLLINSAHKDRPVLLQSVADVKAGEMALMFPSDLLQLVPVKIDQVARNGQFLRVSSCDSEKKDVSFWFPADDTNCILPVSWAEANEIPINGQIENPAVIHLEENDRISEFKNNGKIEVVDPEDSDKICEAVICRVTPPLIWSQISGEKIRVLPFNSTEMFPSGWAENNGYTLSRELTDASPSKTEKEPVNTDLNEETESGNSTANPADVISRGWCPRIYFNYKCFTGPSLSKSKLRNLPRFVGPGPVLLVMQEVISKILSIAYVSSRILNELASDQFMEMLQEHKITKTEGIEFKAKYNNSQKTSRMEIPIIRTSEKVEEYCHIICAHLKCCFNLFGPKLYDGDNCPSNCRGLTKSNKVLKRADYYRQQAIAAKQYLAGESEMPNFESLKELPKGPGRGRGRGKRPVVESNSNSGASDEEKPVVKKVKKKPGRPKKIKAEPVVEENERDDTQSTCSKTDRPMVIDEDVGNDEDDDSKSASGEKENGSTNRKNGTGFTSDNPLGWSVSKVYNFLIKNRYPSFASHFKDHEIDGAALLLLDRETIASSVMTGYTLKFTERDVLAVSQLIAKLQRTWSRRFR